MESEDNKRGRPEIKTSDLPERWKETILDLSKKGASIVEIAVALDISRGTLYALSERDSQFLNTIKKCKRYCEAWWMKKGRTELDNKDFSYTGWYMNMKNRFNWRDKSETDLTTKGDKIQTNIINLGVGVDPEKTD